MIDGLDEIADKGDILKFLADLQLAGGNVKIFVASRLEVDLADAFKSYTRVIIELEDVQPDMEAYILRKLERMHIKEDEDITLEALALTLVG